MGWGVVVDTDTAPPLRIWGIREVGWGALIGETRALEGWAVIGEMGMAWGGEIICSLLADGVTSFQGGETTGPPEPWSWTTGLGALVGVGVLSGDKIGSLHVLTAPPWDRRIGESGGCWAEKTETGSVIGFMRRRGGSCGRLVVSGADFA